MFRSTAKQRPLSQRGASLIEYSMLTALLVLTCIGAVKHAGTSISQRYWMIAFALDNGGGTENFIGSNSGDTAGGH